jgi:protein-S-isoprenylcysteine O-methyltransferase Ste14
LDYSTLGPKALTGLGKFAIALAVLIFLPAWSLTYWQGWLYLVVFVGACFATTMYFLLTDPALVQRRMQAGPAAEREPSQRIIMGIASLGFVLLVVVPAFDHHWRWSAVPVWLVLVSDLGVALSFYLIVLVLRQNSYAAATIQVEAGQPVVSSGIYGVVRHPMYAAALPMFIFTPLALGSYWGLLPALLVIPAILWRLLDEEAYLRRHLPGYVEYCARTRYRLIPGLW